MLALTHLLFKSVDLLDVNIAILLLDVRPQHDSQLDHGYLGLHLLGEHLGLLVGTKRLREGNDVNAVCALVLLVDPELNVVILVEFWLGSDVRVV